MEVILNHRSVRKYKSDAISQDKLNRILKAATRASTIGNMQLYTLVVTQDKEIKKQLSPCHFNQPMVCEAPVVVTVCADINRFSKWCLERDAEPVYDNFVWFVNSAIDAVLAAQNLTIAAEKEGLGICYLGTTVYTASKIADILTLPKGVIPITTIVMGYSADQNTELTDRLPVEAVVQWDTYKDYTTEQINELWSEKESLDLTKQLLKENNLPNLAQVFTKNRYKAEDNLTFSRLYFEELKKQGFFNQ